MVAGPRCRAVRRAARALSAIIPLMSWEFAYIASLTLGLGIVLVFNVRPGWGGGWQATYFIVIGAGAMIASIAGIDALS